MATLSTANLSATIGAVSGNTITLNNPSRAVANTDVNRLIILTSGAGYQQVRKIIARNSNTISLDHPFNESAFPWITEVNPEIGDTCVFSYKDSEAVSLLDSLSSFEQNNIKITSTDLEVRDGAYIHFRNKNVQFSSTDIKIGNNGGLIFGWYTYVDGEAARPKDVCNISDISPNIGTGHQMRVSNTSFGMYHQYGGSIWVKTICFWRLYKGDISVANASTTDVRFINVFVDGNLGCRLDGDRSIVIADASGNFSTLGPFNPRSAVAYPSIGSVDSRQAVYIWLSEGASGDIIITDAIDLSYVLSVNAGNGGVGETMSVQMKKSQIDEIGIFARVTGGNIANQHTLRFGNQILPKFINEDTSTHTGTIKTILRDDNYVTITDGTQTINDGQFDSVTVRHTDIVTKTISSTQDRRLSDGIQYAPYTLTATAWGKIPLVQVISVEDKFDASLTLLNDSTLSETDRSVVDAYTNLDTAEKVYDAAMSWQSDNPDKLHGITRFGKTLDFGSALVNIYKVWRPNTAYSNSDSICHENNFYQARSSFTSGNTFDASNWTELIGFFTNETPPLFYSEFRGNRIYICLDTVLDANIETTGSVRIDDESRILGTIKDAAGVRIRIVLPENSVIKGEYTPPGGATVQIPFETLTSGVKVITMPANTDVKLYSKANGKIDNYDAFNAGENGVVHTPVQIAMNGIIVAEDWVSDLVSSSFSTDGIGRLDLTFNELSDIGTNTNGTKSLDNSDTATLVNAIHFMENYANLCLNAEEAELISSNANRELETEVSIKFILNDTISEFLQLEISMIKIISSVAFETPQNNNALKVRVFIGLNLVNASTPIREETIRRVMATGVGVDIQDLQNDITNMQETINTNASNINTINTITNELSESQELTYLKLIRDISPIPTFTESSVIGNVTVSNGIPTLIRTGGGLADPFILNANLVGNNIFNVNSIDGATEFLLYVRNPGTQAETLRILMEFHENGTAIDENPDPEIITLPANSGYELVHFKLHGFNSSNLIDRLELSVSGLGLQGAGGLEILAMAASRFALPGEEADLILEDIQSKVNIIKADTTFIKANVA